MAKYSQSVAASVGMVWKTENVGYHRARCIVFENARAAAAALGNCKIALVVYLEILPVHCAVGENVLERLKSQGGSVELQDLRVYLVVVARVHKVGHGQVAFVVDGEILPIVRSKSRD